jgi:TolB protein
MSRAGYAGTTGALAAAVMSAAVLLVLAAVAQPAGAAFPGQNGKIAFNKYSPRDDDFRIYTVEPDGTGQSTLGEEPGYSPSWSTDGEMVAFECTTRHGPDTFSEDIFVMNADGGDVRQITSGTAYDYNPTFSPDGETIAFVREAFGSGTDIFTIKLDGTALTQLTNTPTMDEGSLAFSPTGDEVVFSRAGSRNSEILVVNSDGTETENLTKTRRVDEYHPDWSPDGQKITFTSYPFGRAGGEQENADISVMNAADGSERKDLTDGPAFEDSPVFSPDGTRIAFCKITFSRTRGERGDIFTMKADGTGTRRVTDTRAFEYEPAWQPTDGSVAATGTLQSQGITTYQYGDFVLTDEATGQLYAVRASGVDLSALVGQRVIVNGTLVPGYESGQVEDGPPLLDVTQVDPL